MIKQAVDKALSYINYNKAFLKNYNSFYIVFDKESTPYLGIETMYCNSNFDKISKLIELYNISNPKTEFIYRGFDASICYELVFQTFGDDLSIANLFVKQPNAQKGIGSQLLLPATLEAADYNIDKIGAYYSPFDHGELNREKVIKFYQKAKFNIKDNDRPSTYITKDVTPEEILETKLKYVFYPTDGPTFKIFVPSRAIESSYIKGEELGK